MCDCNSIRSYTCKKNQIEEKQVELYLVKRLDVYRTLSSVEELRITVIKNISTSHHGSTCILFSFIALTSTYKTLFSMNYTMQDCTHDVPPINQCQLSNDSSHSLKQTLWCDQVWDIHDNRASEFLLTLYRLQSKLFRFDCS